MNSGCYYLVIKNTKNININIGKLGKFLFPKGYYVYVGSAMRNLSQRIKRHKSMDKKLRWHIDYLLMHTKIISVGLIKSSEDLECRLNQVISEHADICDIIKGFGSSDCKCRSHLHYFKEKPKDFSIERDLL
jgi:Uri superfamily endonuclease